jgi:hypothetical protein
MVESRHVVTSDELQCTAAHHYANTHGVKLRAALIAVLTPPTSLPQPSTTLPLSGPSRHSLYRLSCCNCCDSLRFFGSIVHYVRFQFVLVLLVPCSNLLLFSGVPVPLSLLFASPWFVPFLTFFSLSAFQFADY